MAGFQSTIDADVGTAELALIVSGQPAFTVYEFAYTTMLFTFSERLTPIVMSCADARLLVEAVRAWIEMVYRVWRPLEGSLSLLSKQLVLAATEITATETVGGAPILAGVYNRGTTLFTFAPRPEVTLTWSEAQHWLGFLDEFVVMCEAL